MVAKISRFTVVDISALFLLVDSILRFGCHFWNKKRFGKDQWGNKEQLNRVTGGTWFRSSLGGGRNPCHWPDRRTLCSTQESPVVDGVAHLKETKGARRGLLAMSRRPTLTTKQSCDLPLNYHGKGQLQAGALLKRFSRISRLFQLHFQSLATNLKTIHGLDRQLGTFGVVKTHKT